MKKKKRKNYIICEALACDSDKENIEELATIDLTNVLTKALQTPEFHSYAKSILTHKNNDTFVGKDQEEIVSILEYLYNISLETLALLSNVGVCYDNIIDQTNALRIYIVDATNEHIDCFIFIYENGDNPICRQYEVTPEFSLYYNYKTLKMYEK